MNGWPKNGPGGGRLYFLLELALIASLAVALAHWTWVLVAPRAVAAPAQLSAFPAARGARDLFGAAPARAPADAGGTALRLLGVAASRDADGRAVFVLADGKPKSARAGESIAPGIVLREVHADHVIIEREGAMQRFGLERRGASAGAAPGARRHAGR